MVWVMLSLSSNVDQFLTGINPMYSVAADSIVPINLRHNPDQSKRSHLICILMTRRIVSLGTHPREGEFLVSAKSDRRPLFTVQV